MSHGNAINQPITEDTIPTNEDTNPRTIINGITGNTKILDAGAKKGILPKL